MLNFKLNMTVFITQDSSPKARNDRGSGVGDG